MKRLIPLVLLLAACAGTGGPTTGAAAATPTAGATSASGPTAAPEVTTTPGPTIQPAGTIDFTPDAPSCSDGGTFTAQVVLDAPAAARTLTVTFAKVDESGNETTVGQLQVAVPKAATTSLTIGPLQVSDWCTDTFGAGAYHWRVLRPADGTVLADGLLTVAA